MLKNEHLLAIEITKLNPDFLKIKSLLNSDINYELFFKTIEEHKLKSLLIYNLNGKVENNHSSEYIEKDIESVRTNADNYTAETMRVSYKLFEEGIKCITYKGLAYSYNVYRDKYARGSVDADFLISTEDILKVHRILLNLGYEIVKCEKETTEEYFIKLSKNRKKIYNYYDKEKNFFIEIHHVFNEWFTSKFMIVCIMMLRDYLFQA